MSDHQVDPLPPGARMTVLALVGFAWAKAMVFVSLAKADGVSSGLVWSFLSGFGADGAVLLWLLAMSRLASVRDRFVRTLERVEVPFGVALGLYASANVFMMIEVGRPFNLDLLSVATGTDEASAMMLTPAARSSYIAAGAFLVSGALALRGLKRVREWPGRTVFVALSLYSVVALLYVQAQPAMASAYGLHRNAVSEVLLSAIRSVPVGRRSGSVAPYVWQHYDPPEDPDWLAPVAVAAARRPRNVVLWLAESTGARYTSLHVRSTHTTPSLVVAAQNGVMFTRYYANVPLSSKAIFGTLCGMYPSPVAMPIQKSNPRIACPSLMETLSGRGYRAAFLTGALFGYGDKQKFLGDRGFELMVDGETVKDADKYWRNGWGVDDAAIVTDALAWIDSEPKGRPFLAVMVPIIPHVPYGLPPQAKRRFGAKGARARYDNSLLYADSQFGRFVDALAERGLTDDTLIVYVGDHGEAFQQHSGNRNHGGFIYEENIHVPMVLINPRLFPEKQVSGRLGSHVDLMATIMELIGQEMPSGGQGQSLVGKDYRYRPAIFGAYVREHLGGLRDGPWKYIYNFETGVDEVYNLNTDPLEKVNLASTLDADRVATWRRWVVEHELRQRSVIESYPTLGETYLTRFEREMRVSLVGRDKKVLCDDVGPEGHGVACPRQPPEMAAALTRVELGTTRRECISVHAPEHGAMVIEVPRIDPLPAFVAAGLTKQGRTAGGTPLQVKWSIGDLEPFEMVLEDAEEDSFEAMVLDLPAGSSGGSIRIEVRSENWDNRSGCLILSP